MKQATYYSPPLVLGTPNGKVLDIVEERGGLVDLAHPDTGVLVCTGCKVVTEPLEGHCVLVPEADDEK